MRTRLTLTLALSAAGWWMSGSRADAQQGARAPSGTSGRAYPRVVEPETDPLRPYASRNPRSYYQSRSAYRPPSRPTPRPELIARPSVHAQGVRNYYPAMRAGQGPNRNAVDPRTLCVPGRRAMLLPLQIPSGTIGLQSAKR